LVIIGAINTVSVALVDPVSYISVAAWVAVIVVIPDPTTVYTLTFAFVIVATAGLLLVYVIAPLLFDVGGIIVNDQLIFEDGCVTLIKVPNIVKASTVSVAVVVIVS
jgi:predicted membrane metal-binding protein